MATQADRDADQAARDDLAQYELSYEEGWKIMDAEARHELGISGEEFVRRWDAGEIDFDDPETHSAVVSLWMLLPAVRPEKYEGWPAGHLRKRSGSSGIPSSERFLA
jgi:hypothetical protein